MSSTLLTVLAGILGGGGVTAFVAVYRARAEKTKVEAEAEGLVADTSMRKAEGLTDIAVGLLVPLQAQLATATVEVGEVREKLGRANQRADQAEEAVRQALDRERQLQAQLVILQASGEMGTVMRSILDASPDAVLLVNKHGVVEAANLRAEGMFGFPSTAMRGIPVDELVPERFRSQHEEHRQGYMANPHTRPMGVGMELRGRRIDGTEFPVEIGLSPYQRVGEDKKVVASIRDMTDRLRTLGEGVR